MPANLDPQHAVAVVGIVVGHPLDQSGRRFAIRSGGRAGHAGWPAALLGPGDHRGINAVDNVAKSLFELRTVIQRDTSKRMR